MSPYQYGANNPVRNIDVNGDSIWYTVNDHVVTMHLTAKLINCSSNNLNMSRAADDISHSINGTFRGDFVMNGEKYTLNTDVQMTVANSMNDVSESDHLFVFANADGKRARGATSITGGKVMTLASSDYANDNFISDIFSSNTTFTAMHELGHALGLGHHSNQFNLMKQGGFVKQITSAQRLKIYNNRNNINLWDNYSRILHFPKTPYPYIHAPSGEIYHINHAGLYHK